jgi:hypothetical protein
MREIKFRYKLWSSSRGIVYRFNSLSDIQIHGDPILTRFALSLDAELTDSSEYEILGRDEWIGEKDKNGRDIYENDWLLTDESGWIGKVVFSRATFVIMDDKGRFSAQPNWNKCEVIEDRKGDKDQS